MNRLAKIRQDNKLSQQQLAEMLHVSQQAICKYELGQSEPDISTLKLMADIYHTSVDYIVGYGPSHGATVEGELVIEGNPITPREMEHIKSYRKLTEKWQNNIDLIINDLNLE